MNVLKRHMAPIIDDAWSEIDNQAKRALSTHLSARRFVDVDGPLGWNYTAVPLGRLDLPKEQKEIGVQYGVHKVQPLVELRAFFELDIFELDNIVRGAEDLDLEPLIKAAVDVARFEEKVVYNGFAPGQIKGLLSSCPHKPLTIGTGRDKVMSAVVSAVSALTQGSVSGPYVLVAGPKLWEFICTASGGYPLKKQIEKVIGGDIVLSPFLKDGLIASVRGGDFKLILGQDLSIGYQSHEKGKVRLFITESFTFRVIDPTAFAVLKWEK
jgi:uncharacterized linocin/CFP29 family protein